MALRKKDRTEVYLVLAGIAVASSVCVAGWLHYRAAMRLRDSSQWVKHSYIVSASLELESQRIDRIEPAIKLYQLTRDDDQYRIAETNAVSLYSHALDLQDLVNDNPGQARLAGQLTAQASALVSSVNGLTAQSPPPDQQVLGCRETISLMQRAEAELLSERTKQTDAEDRLGESVGISSTLFSLIVVVILFGFLIRDLRQHHRYQKQLTDTNDQLGETVHALELRARETELMAEARNELQLCMNSQQAQASTARSLERILPATRGAICMINSSLQQVEIASSWNDPASLLDSFSLVSCCGLRSGHARWRKPNKSAVHCEHFTGTEPERYLCLPVAAHGETLGMIYIECPSAGVAAMVESQAPLLSEMIEMASMAIASLNLRNRLEHQSVRDGLTGLFNRHFMEIALERELRRADRQQTPVSLLILDVDHFKKFNDNFGHQAGDCILQHVAEILKHMLRGEDVICRYGGEEFIAILPGMSFESVHERAEQLRRKVSEAHPQFGGENLRGVTVSVGVAMYPLHADSAETLVRAADRALYEAKHQGRNRVVTARLPGAEATSIPDVVTVRSDR
jgi:diguanylate cyclase (GGDEF)-like protein